MCSLDLLAGFEEASLRRREGGKNKKKGRERKGKIKENIPK